MAGDVVEVQFGAQTQDLDAGTDKAIADLDKFEKGIDKLIAKMEQMQRATVEGFVDVENAVRGPTREIGKTGQAVGGLQGQLQSLVGTMVAAFSVQQIVQWATGTAGAVEHLSNLSQQLGVSVTDMTAWQVVSKDVGVGAETMNNGFKFLAKNLEEARGGAEDQSNAFKALGIDITQVTNNSELMLQVAQKFSEMPDGPEKTALSMKVLGRAGSELIPVFNKGAVAITEAMDQARESGAAMSDEMVAKGLAVDDAFDAVGRSVTGLSNNLFSELAPSMEAAADGLTSFMSDMEGAPGVVTPFESVLTGLKIILQAVMIACGAVGVVITDVLAAATITAIPIIAALRAVVISLSRALQGDFSGAMSAYAEETDNAVRAMKAQLDNATQTQRNFGKFMDEVVNGKAAQPKAAAAGSQGGDGAAIAARIKAQQAAALAAKQAALAKQAAAAEATAQRERVQAAREATGEIVEQLKGEQNAAGDNYAQWRTLEQQKLLYVSLTYGTRSKQYQAMLNEMANADRANAVRMQQLAQVAKDSADSVSGTRLEAERDAAGQSLEMERSRITSMRTLGQISAEQELAMIADTNARELALDAQLETALYDMKMSGLIAERDVANITLENKARLNAQIEQLEATHVAKMAHIQGAAATKTAEVNTSSASLAQAKWLSITQPITQGLGTMLQNIGNKQMSWEQKVMSGLKQVAQSFLQMGLQMVANYAASQLAMTGANLAGNTARVASDMWAGATSLAISAATALGQIINYAWAAAAGAFQALVGIPYVGPFLAVGAGAAALAAVIGMASNISSAEGGWERVPYDGAMTELHKDEMVLPSSIANPLRNSLKGWGPSTSPRSLVGAVSGGVDEYKQDNPSGGGSSTRHGDFIYSPTMNTQNQSLRQQLRSQGTMFKKWMANQTRNGA